jgi:hypothetical protein
MKLLLLFMVSVWIICIGMAMSQKEEANIIASEVRLIWGDAEHGGGGEWFEVTEQRVYSLKAWVDQGNKEYPWLNHRLEYR